MEEVTGSELDLSVPTIAKDPIEMARIQAEAQALSTTSRLHLGDARDLAILEDESVHLIVTSPPYWTLKEYNESPDQMGHIEEYEEFLDELDKCWNECLRVLVPGGRIVIVVGDVCLSRRRHGKHKVVPLHADIQVRTERIGFDNLAPIIWYKIANASLEAGGAGSFLGKPYEPNAVIKHDIEWILMVRKSGGYRSPTPDQRRLSIISGEEFNEWFRQIWTIRGESTRNHPAPFPLELAERLVRMFSFVGDTVLDPFNGTGTTMIAAMRNGRDSVGIEIDEEYAEYAKKRIEREVKTLYVEHDFEFNNS